MLASYPEAQSRLSFLIEHKKKRKTRRRKTAEEQVRFAKVSAEFLTAAFEKQTATRIPFLVTKAQIIYVLGDGFSVAQVDRKRKSDPNFPEPIDPNAYLLQWRLDDLLAYQRTRVGN